MLWQRSAQDRAKWNTLRDFALSPLLQQNTIYEDVLCAYHQCHSLIHAPNANTNSHKRSYSLT